MKEVSLPSSPDVFAREMTSENPPKRIAPHSKGIFSWRPTDKDQLAQSEALMLHRIHYHQGVVAGLNTIASVPIRNHAGDTQTDGGKEVMVLIHGFAGGLACWVQNWDFFAAQYELYALDLPGFGRSVRPDVEVTSSEGAIGFICAHLERWFAALQFGRPVILLGHSFGGFVAAHYAMRYGPSQVRLLAMADPWGVNEADPDRIQRAPFMFRVALKVFQTVSPLSPLRAAGPAGPRMFRMVRPDFANRWKGYLEDPRVFYDYTYHSNAQLPPLGETLFKACCHADAAAREPLIESLPANLSREIPVAVLYGSETWMNAERGFTMMERMEKSGFRGRCETVMRAGHQIFTDNVKDFNAQMSRALSALLQPDIVESTLGQTPSTGEDSKNTS